MKSNIQYNKKIAKSFHDTRYYENTEFYNKNLEFMTQEKERLKTNDKQIVTRKINEALDKANEPNEGRVFYILEKIHIKNQDYAFGKNTEKPKNSDLLNLLGNPDLLTVAYQKVRKNKGAMTEASEMSDNEYNKLTQAEKSWVNKATNCPDGITKEIIKITGNLIKQNRYPWGCSRRIYVDKPGKKDVKRPITIPPFMDKIVQEAITMILTAIYEPYFESLNCSFGFRPNKGVHDAIIALTGGNAIGLNMAIEGDIKSAYDKVNRKKFIEIIGRRILDRKFINFLEKRLDYEFYDSKENKYIREKEGLPQGGIDSPYMWNIYMSIFDEYIISHLNNNFDKLNNKPNKTTGNIVIPKRRKNERIRTSIKKILEFINKNKEINLSKFKEIMKKNAKTLKDEKYFTGETLTALTEIRKEMKLDKETELKKIKLNLIKYNNKLTHEKMSLGNRDPNKIKLRFIYIRYADDWIILTNAKQEIVNKIKENIKTFLKEQLDAELSEEKTLITDIREKPAHFLGFEIKTYKSKKIGRYQRISRTGKTITIKATTAGYRVFSTPDQQRLISRLHMKGYCNKNGFPKEIGFLTNLEDFSIIERYNSVIRGLTNYYAEFIKNPKKNLSRWIYIIRYSCIKTLAQKHKSSIRQIFKKYKVPKNLKTPGENTICATVRNIINNEVYEKTWTLIKPSEAIEAAMNLKRKKYLTDVYWSLQNKEAVTYDNSEKHRITNDNFYEKLMWINIRTQASFDLPCFRCGSEENVEMHHIKHVRKNNYKLIDNEQTWLQAMSIRNRNQVPLCRECHMTVHSKRYGGQKISLLCPKKLFDNRIITIESHINKPALNNKKENYNKTLEEKGWQYKGKQDKGINPPTDSN